MRREYVWTHGLDGEQTGVIGHGFLDLWTDERLDQSEQLGFDITADNPKVYLLAEDLELSYRGRRFYITEIEDSRQGTTTTVRVEADALWYRLGERAHVGSLVLESVTPSAGLQLILRETGWVIGPSTTPSSDEFSMEQQDKSALALLRTWAKVTGRVLVFNTAERSVDLADTRGADLGLAFRYGRNLTSVRRRRRPPNLTVLFPYGADDLTIAGINGGDSFVEDFSFYTDQGLDIGTARELYTRSKVWSDSSFIRDVDLLPAAEARLATESQGVRTYELGVLDLSEHTTANEDANVADRVRVFDPSFDEDVPATVSRVRRHRLEPWRNRIELSTLPDAIRDMSSSGSRPPRSAEWHQFVGPVSAEYQIRNDGDYITNRIPLSFREGGRANFHLDLHAVSVGAGVMHVEVVDGADQQFYTQDVAYTDGDPVRAHLQWATEDLTGQYDFRVRVTTVASGGPSPTNGVNIAADVDGEASFWIMAQGAIQQTPTAANSQRFEFTGAVQSFTIPDNITEIVIETAGGGASAGGGIVTHTRTVIPGTIYEVNVGGLGQFLSSTGPGGWPNGGDAHTSGGAPHGVGGGGSSDVRPTGTGMASAIVVAAGAGGGAANPALLGGAGGFYVGEDGPLGAGVGGGATQFAGGVGYGSGTDGTFGQGGDGVGGHSGLSYPGGGGGGGWYGGAASNFTASPGLGASAGGGGGGSGWLADGAFDILIADDANHDDGYIEFRWETPG